jgi:NAD-dependent DNA ligase
MMLMHRERLPRVLDAAGDIVRWVEPATNEEPEQTGARDNALDARGERSVTGRADSELTIGPCSVAPGSGAVVLADHPGVDRANLIEKAELLGFAVRPEVTPSTSLLVVGKVESMSRRARIARELGIPIASASDLLNASADGPIPAERQAPGSALRTP